jgi:phenylalanyl-tRNA synthetase beta chain
LPGARVGGRKTEVVAVEIGGVVSSGRICSADDLDLRRLFPSAVAAGDILELDGIHAVAGQPLAEVLGWNDVILEIDNKSLTNRPDLWGHYGIAREFAAIYGLHLKALPAEPRPEVSTELIGRVDTALCQRLAVVEFVLADAELSPLWLRSRLARIGEAAVNLSVDLSNYVMFTVGQPTHAYDEDRLRLPLEAVIEADATALMLLGGQSVPTGRSWPVIKDADGPVALAGVMGGKASAVSHGSRRYALEAATFHPRVIRRASQQLALRTEASSRFEKGIDTQRVDQALDLYLYLLRQVAPRATVLTYQDVNPDPTSTHVIDLDLAFLATRIGRSLDPAEIRRTLEALGFALVEKDKPGHLRITAPTWRSTGDISGPHDLVEEVARIHGYDEIPIAPITVALKQAPAATRNPLDRRMREQLAARAGLQEVITYPWAADSFLLAAGVDKKQTIQFEGAPAPDRDSLRTSLIPNLLEAAVANLRYSDSFGIFEIGTVFDAGPLVEFHGTFEPLPRQPLMAAVVLVGVDGSSLFQQAKGIVEMLRRQCHITDLQLVPTGSDTAPWADSSARLGLVTQEATVGTLGLLTPRSRRLAGIDGVQVACFELDLTHMAAHATRENNYHAISDLPPADFDLSVVIAEQTTWLALESVFESVGGLVSRVAFIDEFRGSWVPDGHKSTTLRVTLQPTSATLTADDIAATRAEILVALERELGARLRA